MTIKNIIYCKVYFELGKVIDLVIYYCKINLPNTYSLKIIILQCLWFGGAGVQEGLSWVVSLIHVASAEAAGVEMQIQCVGGDQEWM